MTPENIAGFKIPEAQLQELFDALAELHEDNGLDPNGQGSTVWMQDLDPAKPLRHAMHIDVTTASGTVRGRARGDHLAFAGIPYAAPPVGPHRFVAPRPVEPWTGVRDATAFGPIAPQNPSPLEGMLGASIVVVPLCMMDPA